MSSHSDQPPDPGEAGAPNKQSPDQNINQDQQARSPEPAPSPEITGFYMLTKSMREFLKDLGYYRVYPLFETGNLYGLSELNGLSEFTAIDLEDLRKLVLDEVIHLKIQLEEINSRIGDGWADDYFAAIEAHKVIKEFAERCFPDGISMEKLGMDYNHALPPEEELEAMLWIIYICIEYLEP